MSDDDNFYICLSFIYIAVHWALPNNILFSADFFHNNISFYLFFPAPAPLAEDTTTSIDLMKRRRKKKKKKAVQPKALTTLDTDIAATWKMTMARTGPMRPHHSPRCQHPLSEMHPHNTVTVCLACKVDHNCGYLVTTTHIPAGKYGPNTQSELPMADPHRIWSWFDKLHSLFDSSV